MSAQANPQNSNVVALNNESHRNLTVVTKRGAEYGEATHLVPVVANELRNLVLEYPVCITKDPSNGQFALCALLGFEPGENLYLNGESWDAQYIPMHIRRQPFMVGYQNPQAGAGEDKGAVITLDLSSKRIHENGGEGERLFDDEGHNTPFMQQVSDLMGQLIVGMESTTAFLNTLADNDLIEPAHINVQFASGEQKRYEGLYTVNEEKLQKLEADKLLHFHQHGYLQAAYWLGASLGQVRKLIAVKNTKKK
ncbi:SapC family protein [Microbulbifer elongatus]|uniref:SapC family protein n=1 Tax=Microbulbifer elongatus TaxID=86173 RepID=A0ABT1P4J6_9GAMM|nr:SapC family protein [Microbulbifer elongatus]MCQ3831036.1 SapC family protein [Microbulbifer elongatus]